jgi:hypothetical protein
VPFGKYCRSVPFVFSLEPCRQGLWESQKQTAMSVATLNSRCRDTAEPNAALVDPWDQGKEMFRVGIRSWIHAAKSVST